jgi:hypothetical protein
MEILTLINTVYNKNQYQKVIDTSFTQLVQPTITSSIVSPTISVAEFFQNYQQLFFQIPKLGNTNSHEYLIKTSTAYIGNAQNDELIQSLLEEITQLKGENVSLLQTITTLQK